MAPIGIGQKGSFTTVWQSVAWGVSELFGRTFSQSFVGESASPLPPPVERREGFHEDEVEDEEIGSCGGEPLEMEITNGAGRLAPFWGGWSNSLWNLEQGLFLFEVLRGRLIDTIPRK